MVNTRTELKLAAAVSGQKWRPCSQQLVFLDRLLVLAEEKVGRIFGLGFFIKSILDHVLCIRLKDVAQVCGLLLARNLEILRDRDDYDRSERCKTRGYKSGEPISVGNSGRYNYRSLRSENETVRDLTGRAIPRWWTPRKKCRPCCLVLASSFFFKCGQAGHLQRDCKKNIGASSSGHADKKPDALGRQLLQVQSLEAFISYPPPRLNALPLDMCEFDIILGMDWLAAHRATIDCHSRRVIFGDIHAPEFIYHGSLPGKSMKIISALKARTLLSHGCEGFLATIHDTTSDISSIHDQPIVSEFQDVFPEELPGIPPIRDVEFNIELIPGAEPTRRGHRGDYNRRVRRLFLED
ncbi:putative reverse transcriptase domain-containing protein [Tanacetum coccineum]